MGQLSNPPDTLETLTPQGVTVGWPACRDHSTLTISAPGAAETVVQETPGQLSNPEPRPVQRRLSEAEIDGVARCYLAGWTLASVALEFGVHQRTIAAHLEDRGIPRRVNHRKMTEGDVAQAASRYREGESFAETGAVMGLDPATVRRELHRAGVPLRPRPGWVSAARRHPS